MILHVLKIQMSDGAQKISCVFNPCHGDYLVDRPIHFTTDQNSGCKRKSPSIWPKTRMDTKETRGTEYLHFDE